MTVTLLTDSEMTGCAKRMQGAAATATTATRHADLQSAVRDRHSLCATSTLFAARASVMLKNLATYPPP